MVHIYKRRNRLNDSCKILCTPGIGIWVDIEEGTTQAHHATCPKCLDVVIPALEANLILAKANRALCAKENPEG